MIVHGHRLSGTVTLETESQKGRAWLRRHVSAEPWQWQGVELVIDARSAAPIVTAARAAGLVSESA